MADRKTWEEQVKGLAREEAPADLLARITTVVPNLPQQHVEEKSFTLMLTRFVSEWRYGFALKVAGFACVAFLGVMAGQSVAEQDAVSALVFGDIGWENMI